MEDKTSWDWDTELKEVPFDEWRSRFNWVQTPQVSHNGEGIAAVVNLDEMAFNVCVNGEVWEEEYEKAWSLTPVSGSGFAAFVARDEEWTLAVNGQEWSHRCDFIWQLMKSPDGQSLGAAFQADSEYGIIVNDTPWDNRFENLTGAVMAADGTSAAVVQMISTPGADVTAFREGVFSVARNGVPEDLRFLNIWDISFDSSGRQIGYGVRTNREPIPLFRMAPCGKTGSNRCGNRSFWMKNLFWPRSVSTANGNCTKTMPRSGAGGMISSGT